MATGIISSTLERLTEEPQGSVSAWLAFVGILIVLSYLWSRVLKSMVEAV